jgi:hypothetical protein
MSTSANEVQVPAAQDTPRNICIFFLKKICMGAGKQTVFLLPVPSGASAKRAKLGFTHLMHATLALFAPARARGVLAAGCMEAGIRLA